MLRVCTCHACNFFFAYTSNVQLPESILCSVSTVANFYVCDQRSFKLFYLSCRFDWKKSNFGKLNLIKDQPFPEITAVNVCLSIASISSYHDVHTITILLT